MSISDPVVDAALLLDRLVSATSSDDIVDSLQRIIAGVPAGHLTSEEVVSELEVVQALVQVLQNQNPLLNLSTGEAQPLVLRLYLLLLEKGNTRETAAVLLQEPTPGRLLEAVVDVASDASRMGSSNSYTRVLALQLLRALATAHSKLAQSQVLAAPNGLHRLGDLLKDSTDEQVRNEALRLAAVLAEWASVAKVWMFSEVGDVVLQTAIEEGGLTGGNVLVQDCLHLLQTMLKHDAALAELVFQSPVLAPNLQQILDLRGGTEFLNPTQSQQQFQKHADSNVDDLDDLLQSSPSKIQSKPLSVPVPRLTGAEERVLHSVFDIFATVLENESVKHTVWRQHQGLCNLVWEMALIAKPPPGQEWYCGVPSVTLQQRALHIVAKYFHSPEIMSHIHSGLDRVLYLVCTAGNYRGETLEEQMSLQQSALHVLRRTLPDATVNEMLMHTLAPPPIDDESDANQGNSNNDNTATSMVQPPVVQKLINTAQQQLPQSSGDDDPQHRQLLLAGSLGALALLLTDEAHRSILLRVTEPTSFLDAILESLLHETNETSNDFVALHLLRFLSQWMTQAPLVTQAFLQSHHAATISLLYVTSMNGCSNKNSKPNRVAALIGLVFGLCLEYMGDDESRCGGWTRAGILELLQGGGGISNFLSTMEQLKKDPELPWSYCELEWNVWVRWCERAVLVVRKRVVQALTMGGQNVENDDDNSNGIDATVNVASTEMKSMQRLVSEQANEIEQLRMQLTEAQRQNASKEKQLATWKQRVESTPTQLDEMLDELASKNSDLELKIGSLEEEIMTSTEKHQSELQSRDNTIAMLQQQLADCQAIEVQVRQEGESLRSDMEALSQAYSSLEEEYRRQQSVVGQTTGLSSTGEQAGSEHQQPQGEESNQAPTGSTEVATLRAENSRLRNDAEAADEWMATAMERMGTMAAEINLLQQNLDSVQSQLDQANATSKESGDEVASHLIQETESRVSLERELMNVSQQLNKEKETCDQLQNQLLDAHKMADATASSLEETIAHRDQLQISLNVLKLQLEESVTMRNQNDKQTIDSESVQLHSTLESLQNSLISANSELEISRQSYEAELLSRDARIKELESAKLGRLSMETCATAESQTRDEEIAQLQKANDEAQEWMSKAVEHHKALVQQVATLSQQNSDLEAQLNELKEANESQSNESVSNAVLERLRLEMNDRDAEICRLQDLLAKSEKELQLLQSQNEKITQLQKESIDMQALVDSIRSEIKVKDNEIANLRNRVVASDFGDEYINLLTEKEALQADLVLRDDRLKVLEEEVHDLRIEKDDLLLKIADLEATKVEFGTTEEEFEALRARASEVEARNASIEKLLDAVATEKKELELESQKSREALEQIENELQQLRAGDGDLIDSDKYDEKYDEKVKEMRQHIKDLEMRLTDEKDEANSVIQQWEETYETMQAHNATIERQLKDALTEQEILSSELAKSRDVVTELELQISEQEKEAQETVSQWQASHNELQADYNILYEEKIRCESQLEQSQNQLRIMVAETDEKGKEFELRVKNLEDQLADQEADAVNVVDQWQESYDKLAEDLRLHVENLSLVSAEAESIRETANEKMIDLERQLVEQSDEAASVVQQWQDSYDDLAQEKESLLQQFEESQKALCELRLQLETIQKKEENSRNERALRKNQESAEKSTVEKTESDQDGDTMDGNEITQLKSTITDLYRQLDDQAEEARDALLEWQRSHEQLSVDLQEVHKEALDAAKSVTFDSDDIEISKFQHQVQMLRASLKEKEEETSTFKQDYSEVMTKQLQEYRDALLKQKAQLDEVTACNAVKSSELDIQTNHVRQLEKTVLNLQEQLKDREAAMTNTMSERQESYDNVTSQLQDLKVESEVFRKAHDESEQMHSDTEADFKMIIKDLEEQLQSQELSMMQWKVAYDDVSDRLKCSEVALEKEREALASALQELDATSNQNAAADDMVNETHGAVAGSCSEQYEKRDDFLLLEETLQKLQEELHLRNNELESSKARLRESIDMSQRLQVTLDQVVTSSADDKRVSELESTIADLENQLATHDEEAVEAVAQWEESYYAILTEKEELAFELIKAQDSLVEIRKLLDEKALVIQHDVEHSLKQQLEELNILLTRGSQEKLKLENQVLELRSDVSIWKNNFDNLQQKLMQQNDAVPRQTPSIVSTLESRISDHIQTNHRLESELIHEKEERRLAQRQLADAEEQINSQLESHDTELSRMKERIQSERLEENEKIASIEQDIDKLRMENGQLRRQRDDLKAHIAELEDELRETNDALQLRLTNEVSDVASDLASRLLREQIHDMRAQAHQNDRELSDERKAREQAESEVERLRADLAALLGVEDLEENRSEIEKRVLEATEKFQRTERAEIASLRKSLERALEELSNARTVERGLEERAAKAIHEAALFEQEIITAKSDFKFLSLTMDEMRESETTRRAALEYRISSLENDRSVQQRYYTLAIENLHTELSQVCAERDRLFEALKESEKNREALIHASTREHSDMSEADPYVELTKLRVEKAQLLTAAEEEASRNERRLRETRDAARASAEADIILEKELRMNAENSLESMKIELAETRARMETLTGAETLCSKDEMDSLRSELSTLHKSNERLNSDCENLREQLATLQKESKFTVERMKEECQQAKAKANHLEREGRYEAAVRAEVARLQAPLSVVTNPANNYEPEEALAVTKLYDVIQRQKQAIEEERSVYFELLNEHDDLLALVTQQDYLKASLISALSREVGQSAVDAAIKDAEENVLSQFGKKAIFA